MATIIGKIRKKEAKKPELTVKEIKDMLDELGIEYPSNATKAGLLALLP